MKYFWRLSIFIAIFFIGSFAQEQGYLSLFKQNLANLSNKPKTIYHRLTTNPKTINLIIDSQALAKLEQKRQEAIQLGFLLTTDDDIVSATIEFQNQTFSAEVRLKGDLPDHFAQNQWSLRIYLKNKQTIMGMNRFSLQPPATRNYLNEWLFFQALEQADVIALNYDFVALKLNGQSEGIYALEEHFGQELLIHNQRPPGPIIKFNEDAFWEMRTNLSDPEWSQDWYIYRHSLIEPFQWSEVERKADLYQQFLQAEKLLNQYRQKELSADQVFDYDTWATYFALTDVFAVRHGLIWHNLRFYYHPEKNKLEPVPFDNIPGEHLEEIFLHRENLPQFQSFIQDPDFVKLYFQKLHQFINPDYLDQLLADHQDQIKTYSKLLNRDQPYVFDNSFLFNRQSFIKNIIFPSRPLLAYLTNDLSQIELQNTERIPLKIIGFKTSKSEVLLNQPLFLPANLPDKLSPLHFLDLPLNFELPSQVEKIEIIYQFTHSEEKFTQPLQSWPHHSLKTLTGIPINQLPGIIFNHGQYVLAQDTVVDQIYLASQGEKLLVLPGVKLDFISDGQLISSIPTFFLGQSDNPVKIFSSDHQGKGILISNVSDISKIAFTQIKDLDEGLTLYRSPAILNHVTLDQIKLVNTQAKIQTIALSHSFNALQADFSQSEINFLNCFQIQSGCLDLNHSQINLSQANFNQFGHHALQADNLSRVNLTNISASQGEFGFIAKDESIIGLDGVKLDNIDTAFLASQGSAIQVHETLGPMITRNIKNRFLIQDQATIFYRQPI
jgi:hypothetical protein